MKYSVALLFPLLVLGCSKPAPEHVVTPQEKREATLERAKIHAAYKTRRRIEAVRALGEAIADEDAAISLLAVAQEDFDKCAPAKYSEWRTTDGGVKYRLLLKEGK